jgi:hypothetical protein
VLVLVIVALVLVAACVAYPLLRRDTVLSEVDRFRVARSLTTTWSTEPQPEVHIPASGEQVDEA